MFEVSLIPSREVTYPTWEKENHLQKCLGRGYVSSLQGSCLWILMLLVLYKSTDLLLLVKLNLLNYHWSPSPQKIKVLLSKYFFASLSAVCSSRDYRWNIPIKTNDGESTTSSRHPINWRECFTDFRSQIGCWFQPIWNICCSSNWILSPGRIDWTKNIGNHQVVVAIIHVVSGHVFRGYSSVPQGWDLPRHSFFFLVSSPGWVILKILKLASFDVKTTVFFGGFSLFTLLFVGFSLIIPEKTSLKISTGEIGWTFKAPQKYPAVFQAACHLGAIPTKEQRWWTSKHGLRNDAPKKTQLEVLKKKHNFGKFITGSF